MAILKRYNSTTEEFELVDSGAINDGTTRITPNDILDLDPEIEKISGGTVGEQTELIPPFRESDIAVKVISGGQVGTEMVFRLNCGNVTD